MEAACLRVGRDVDSVELVAVSKKQPLSALHSAYEGGQRIFGESRLQEAEAKLRNAGLPNAVWHMVGPMQSNKARRIAELFDVVHSVDRIKIARLLQGSASQRQRKLGVFIQVNLGAEPAKSGFSPTGLREQVRPLLDMDALQILGLMAIPPRESDPDRTRSWFRDLRGLRDGLEAWGAWGRGPLGLSMGMSGDFEMAIEEGATLVRVGTGVFGARESS